MDAPADLKEWLFRADGLPLPPSVPHGDRPHWRGETAVCYGLSDPLVDVSFQDAVGQAVSALWADVHRRLRAIAVTRECCVALPSIIFQDSYEGYRLRAQTMITWSEPVGPPVRDDANGEFEIELATH